MSNVFITLKGTKCHHWLTIQGLKNQCFRLGWKKIKMIHLQEHSFTLNFPTTFTFVREKRIWKIRERKFSIGRLGHCTPAQGELYYLCILLSKVCVPKCYADIMTVNNVVYSTFREACFYALGLLDDDNEFIDTIKKASLCRIEYYTFL